MPEPLPVGAKRKWTIQVVSGSFAALLALSPIAAPAAPSDLPPPMPDGRMFGHLPYAEAARTDLLVAPPGFAVGLPCLIHRDAAPDLTRMLAAAAATPGVGASLHSVSCFRSVARQRTVFCRNAAPGICRDPVSRARSIGPPGYSEHATGYAIDFGVRPAPGCPRCRGVHRRHPDGALAARACCRLRVRTVVPSRQCARGNMGAVALALGRRERERAWRGARATNLCARALDLSRKPTGGRRVRRVARATTGRADAPATHGAAPDRAAATDPRPGRTTSARSQALSLAAVSAMRLP